MHVLLFLLGLVLTATAAPAPDDRNIGDLCKEQILSITVNVPRYVFTTDITDNWDVTSLVFNLTRRDVGTSQNPLPVAQALTEPRQSTYNISTTICGRSKRFLILTHGIIESQRYWQPDFPGNEKYNFVKAALAAGYSVVNYDRVGVGKSSTVSSFDDAQFQVHAAVLNSIVDYTRKTLKASKVALIGHSYGSYLTVASASEKLVDAIALTGFSGNLSYFAPFLAGASLRVANSLDPNRWSHLDTGYIQPVDLYATAYIYFKAPYFDHKVSSWAHGVEAQPFAVGELPSLLRSSIRYSNVKAPVLVLQGQYDLSACGGNCIGVLNGTENLFTESKALQYVDNLPAGHNINFHYIAPEAFKRIFKFLKSQGI